MKLNRYYAVSSGKIRMAKMCISLIMALALMLQAGCYHILRYTKADRSQLRVQLLSEQSPGELSVGGL